MTKKINIVIPTAGTGTSFINAGYTFPKPLIDIKGKPMIQLIIENLRPKVNHKFILICQNEHYNKYSLNQVFNNSTKGNFECIRLFAPTQGAACTVLTAIDHINDEELIIANADQVIDIDINKFIKFARDSKADGVIMTFNSLHPRWSYVRTDKKGLVIEAAEKKVISNKATVGIYYFKNGSDFIKSAFSMIEKNIRFNNDFYVCPVYNEMILSGKKILSWNIPQEKMHSLGTPEDLSTYLSFLEKKV
jgi:NDP-sugar pyrophosphorylase family protein